MPTTLDWKLPAGFRAAPIEWPAPKALQIGPLVNYGYEGTALHLVRLDVPPDLKLGADIFADVLLDATMPTKAVTREKEVQIAGIKEEEEKLTSVARNLMREE